jgi:hypothetical protein
MQEQFMPDPPRRNYDKDNDQHVFAIDRLVHELGMPAEDVNRIYREILDEMKEDVSARAFLPILVSMGVKERLGEQHPFAR